MNALVLSYALDTNGQNARYVYAAERWGDDPSVLKALAIGKYDPAGVVARYKVAADKLGGLKIRSVHRTKAYFDFPDDIVWTRQNDKDIRQLVLEADVVHLNNSYRALQHFGIRKPMLLHHHGSMFRQNPKHMLAMARAKRMAQAVSTIDLLQPDPKALNWLPTAYDIGELAKLGKAHRRKPDGRIRLVSAPTNREYKHTALLIKVCAELQAEGVPIDLVLVEGVTNAECLVEKAKADIVFDQLMFGYGCNAVEAWGLGVPVIAGGDEWTLDEMRRQWGYLPFYSDSVAEPTTEATLKEHIKRLVGSADLRADWAGVGMAHVLKYHDEKPALERLAELYALAIEYGRSVRAIPGKPIPGVVFRSKRNTMSIEGVSVSFVKGLAEVTDPDLIARLRLMAKTRPNYGIKEVA